MTPEKGSSVAWWRRARTLLWLDMLSISLSIAGLARVENRTIFLVVLLNLAGVLYRLSARLVPSQKGGCPNV